MKKLILIVLFIPLTSFGQIGKSDVVTVNWVEIGNADKLLNWHTLNNIEGTDQYYLRYRNFKYRNIDDFKYVYFNATKDELDYLYNALMEPLIKKDKEDRTIKVGDCSINYFRRGPSLMLYIDHPTGVTDGEFFVTKKKLQKLFGKR